MVLNKHLAILSDSPPSQPHAKGIKNFLAKDGVRSQSHFASSTINRESTKLSNWNAKVIGSRLTNLFVRRTVANIEFRKRKIVGTTIVTKVKLRVCIDYLIFHFILPSLLFASEKIGLLLRRPNTAWIRQILLPYSAIKRFGPTYPS
jgi:hypothetical protein